MSGLGCLQYLWILPLFCRSTLLYFLVFNLFPNFLASLDNDFVLVFFCFILVITLRLFYFLSLFFVPLIRFTCLLILLLVYSESYLPIFLLSVCLLSYSSSARYNIFSSSRFLLLICRPECIIQSALNGFGCIQIRAD